MICDVGCNILSAASMHEWVGIVRMSARRAIFMLVGTTWRGKQVVLKTKQSGSGWMLSTAPPPQELCISRSVINISVSVPHLFPPFSQGVLQCSSRWMNFRHSCLTWSNTFNATPLHTSMRFLRGSLFPGYLLSAGVSPLFPTSSL